MVTGGCYCGSVRYQADGEPVFKAQCHCRECQYYSGGHPNIIAGFPKTAFRYTKGAPKAFSRDDLGDKAASREFCGTCGTPIASRVSGASGLAFVKVGTFDDPAAFGTPNMAIQTADKQSFHTIPEGIPTFERFPG